MIDAFISHIKTIGLARTNRYQVRMHFPTGTALTNTYILSNLFCEVAGLPGYNVATQPHRIFGESREVPYEPMYDPISFTFYSDAQMQIKDAFETWMSLIIDPITKTSGYYSQYTSQIDILLENVDGGIPYSVTLYEAYPKTMHTVTLDQNSKEVMRIIIGMSYKYWRSNSLFSQARSTPVTYTTESDPKGVSTGTGSSDGYFGR